MNERAKELAETWINGNKHDVRAALGELPALQASLLALQIAECLGSRRSDLILYLEVVA